MTAATFPTAERTPSTRPRRTRIGVLHVIIVGAWLAGWQWIPQVPGASDVSPLLDPFFVSSPTEVAKTLYELATGANDTQPIWGQFWKSMAPALAGTAMAMVGGSLAGLVCSNWPPLYAVLRPFLVTFNALPRITMVPVIILVAGPTTAASLIIGFLLVFFVVFFNAYEGGQSVPAEVVHNAKILGAGPLDELRYIRWPRVFIWSFTQLPNAVAFGLVAIITAEVFGSSEGLGQVLVIGAQTADASLTISVSIILGVTALALIAGANVLKNRVLRWQ